MPETMNSHQQKMLEDLRSFSKELGRAPSQKDMRELNEDYDSEYPYRREFGTWNNAKVLAGLEVQEYKYEIEEPDQSEKLAWFLGVLSGDGSVVVMENGGVNVTLTAGDKELVDKWQEAGQMLFGMKGRRSVQVTNGEEYDRVNFSSVELGEYLGDFGYKGWAETVRKDFSFCIDEFPEYFLAGLIDAEGSVSRSVKIHCMEEDGRAVIKECLDNLGVRSQKDKYGVRMNVESSKRLLSFVKPVLERKQSIEGV